MRKLTPDDIERATTEIVKANALLKFAAFAARNLVELQGDAEERKSLSCEVEYVFRAIRDHLDGPMEVLMDLENGGASYGVVSRN